MASLRIPIIIGSINCLYYFAAAAIAIAELVKLAPVEAKPDYFPLVIVVLVYSLVMTVLSGLLILAAIRKHAPMIALWVLLSGAGMLASILYLIVIGHNLVIWEMFSSLSFIAIQSISWYSIYLLWRDTRNGDNVTDLNQAKPHQTQAKFQPTIAADSCAKEGGPHDRHPQTTSQEVPSGSDVASEEKIK